MKYVDHEYYCENFHGESVDDTDFPQLCERASEIVEEMTMYRVNEESFSRMPEHMQEKVKKAICAQIEYLDANGGSEMDTGMDLQSAGLGKFNFSKASGGNNGDGQSIYASRALRYLAPTGLLYRGGGSY